MYNENGDPVELITAFHLMWDHFPDACTLVHRTKRVVAVNPPCKDFGREVGMFCSRHGPPETHADCLAAKAISDHTAQVARRMVHDQERIIYWLPVDGYGDYYIHFSVRVDEGGGQ